MSVTHVITTSGTCPWPSVTHVITTSGTCPWHMWLRQAEHVRDTCDYDKRNMSVTICDTSVTVKHKSGDRKTFEVMHTTSS